MPKLKSKSSAKKRFRFTASGKVLSAGAGKQHGMRKRNSRMLRQARGTMVLADVDARRMQQYLPYGN